MLDRLFSPLTINGKTLKNRCVVTPMLMNFCEEDGTCTERFAAYHEAKAKGGFAMIVTENVAVTSVAKGYQWIPGLYSRLPGLDGPSASIRYRHHRPAEPSRPTGL